MPTFSEALFDKGQRPTPALANYVLNRLHFASLVAFLQIAIVHGAKLELERQSVPANSAGESTDEFIDQWRKLVADVPLDDHYYLVQRMNLSLSVDLFLHYVIGMLRAVFEQRPEMLISSEKVTVQEVMSHPSIDSFREMLAERKVQSLSYKSFADLLRFLRKQYGVALSLDAGIETRVAKAIQVRNLLVHNDGIVNNVYLQRTGDTGIADGERYPLDSSFVAQSLSAMHSVVLSIELELVDHFSLKLMDREALDNNPKLLRGIQLLV